MEVEPPVELVSDWAWSAAIRFCMKVWNAAAISEEEAVVLELAESVPVEALVDEELVDEQDPVHELDAPPRPRVCARVRFQDRIIAPPAGIHRLSFDDSPAGAVDSGLRVDQIPDR